MTTLEYKIRFRIWLVRKLNSINSLVLEVSEWLIKQMKHLNDLNDADLEVLKSLEWNAYELDGEDDWWHNY